jgi:hypothetical protein
VVHTVHQLMNAPPHATKFQNGVWICNARQRYQSYSCTVKRCGEMAKGAKLIAPAPRASGSVSIAMGACCSRVKACRTLSIINQMF